MARAKAVALCSLLKSHAAALQKSVAVSNLIQTRGRDRLRLTNAGRFPGPPDSRAPEDPTPTAPFGWCLSSVMYEYAYQSPALRGSVIWLPRWPVLNHNRLTIFQIEDGHFDIRISRFQILRGLDRDRFDVAV